MGRDRRCPSEWKSLVPHLCAPNDPRSIKKGAFLVLRQSLYTVQATIFVEGCVGRPMVQYAQEISKESVVDVRGKVVKVPTPVLGCTQKEVEVKIQEVRCPAKAVDTGV